MIVPEAEAAAEAREPEASNSCGGMTSADVRLPSRGYFILLFYVTPIREDP